MTWWHFCIPDCVDGTFLAYVPQSHRVSPRNRSPQQAHLSPGLLEWRATGKVFVPRVKENAALHNTGKGTEILILLQGEAERWFGGGHGREPQRRSNGPGRSGRRFASGQAQLTRRGGLGLGLYRGAPPLLAHQGKSRAENGIGAQCAKGQRAHRCRRQHHQIEDVFHGLPFSLSAGSTASQSLSQDSRDSRRKSPALTLVSVDQ